MKLLSKSLLVLVLLGTMAFTASADPFPVDVADFEMTFVVDVTCASHANLFALDTDNLVVTGNHADLGNYQTHETLTRIGDSHQYTLNVMLYDVTLFEPLEYQFGVYYNGSVAWDTETFTVTPTGNEPDADNDQFLDLYAPIYSFGGEELCTCIDVMIWPLCRPVLDADGDYLRISGSIESDYWLDVELDAWIELTYPNGDVHLIRQETLTIEAYEYFEYTNRKYFPASMPAGEYQVCAKIGLYPDVVISEDCFALYKQESGVASLEAEAGVYTPTVYSIGEAYPNPFNPETSIEINLPEAAELTVTAYNVQGQQVGVLANSTFSAGNHTLSFDGANLPSGLYFIQATVPGHLNEIRRVTLMK